MNTNTARLTSTLAANAGRILAVTRVTPAAVRFDEFFHERVDATVLAADGKVQTITLASYEEGLDDTAFKAALDVAPDADAATRAAASEVLAADAAALFDAQVTPSDVARHALASRMAKFPKGMEVEVVRGRKVAVGTVGVVVSFGEGQFGPWLRIRLASGEEVFVSRSNCQPSSATAAAVEAVAAEAIAAERAEAIAHAAEKMEALKVSCGGASFGGRTMEFPGFSTNSIRSRLAAAVAKAYGKSI